MACPAPRIYTDMARLCECVDQPSYSVFHFSLSHHCICKELERCSNVLQWTPNALNIVCMILICFIPTKSQHYPTLPFKKYEFESSQCIERGGHVGRRSRKVQHQQQGQGQKLVDYSLHVRAAEYWDRLNVLFPASRCSVMPHFLAC